MLPVCQLLRPGWRMVKPGTLGAAYFQYLLISEKYAVFAEFFGYQELGLGPDLEAAGCGVSFVLGHVCALPVRLGGAQAD